MNSCSTRSRSRCSLSPWMALQPICLWKARQSWSHLVRGRGRVRGRVRVRARVRVRVRGRVRVGVRRTRCGQRE